MPSTSSLRIPIVLAFVLALGETGAAAAGTIDELMQRQRNGFWETSIKGGNGKPLAFCVTDRVKVGAVQQTREAMRQMGCRTDKDVVTGNRFEMQLQCSSPDPNVGRFRLAMRGEMRGDFFSSAGTITGGGPLVQAIAASPDLRRSEWRWKRPCTANEKPGLQAG